LALGILQKRPTPPAVFVKHQLITPKNVGLVYPLDAGVEAAPRPRSDERAAPSPAVVRQKK